MIFEMRLKGKIPIVRNDNNIRCTRECDSNPVGIFYAVEGCICSTNKLQALCYQHYFKAEQNGVDLEPILYFNDSCEI